MDDSSAAGPVSPLAEQWGITSDEPGKAVWFAMRLAAQRDGGAIR